MMSSRKAIGLVFCLSVLIASCKKDDPKPSVRESLNFSTNQPVVVEGDDSSKVTTPKKPAWKPGDGIKKVTAVVHKVVDSLKPKPKPASDAPAA